MKNLFSPLKKLIFITSFFSFFLSQIALGQYSQSFSTTAVWTKFDTQTLTGIDWTASGTSGIYFGGNTNGQQFGSSSKPAKTISLTTNGFAGSITSVKVTSSGASGTDAKLSVSVGGVNLNTSPQSITTSSVVYTFTGNATGELVITWNQTKSTAIYVKKIEVTYADCATPLNQAQSLTISNVGTTGFSVNWTKGADATSSLVYVSTSATAPTPSIANIATANPTFTSSPQAVYAGTGNSVNVNGLSASATYYVHVFSYNCGDADAKFNTIATTANETTNAPCTDPTSQPVFTSATASANSIVLSWNYGDSDHCIVVASEDNDFTSTVTNGTIYNANANYSSGQQLATGEYVVYNGSANSVNVTGLQTDVKYYFAIYGYCNATTPNYVDIVNEEEPSKTEATTIANSCMSTNCLEIESILVDACVKGTTGADEAINELVTFVVGDKDFKISDLRVDKKPDGGGAVVQGEWPGSSLPVNKWLGVCAPTSNATSVLNQFRADIISPCGQLLVPTGDILAAGSKVVLFTSTDLEYFPDYFKDITETIYAIFQCAGNDTKGHFSNATTNTNDSRTLILANKSTGCSDEVTYVKSGLYPAADGDAVYYDWTGTPDYINTSGCIAPVKAKPLPSISSAANNVCVGQPVSLTSKIDGNACEITSYEWTSDKTGTFANKFSANTTYTPADGENGTTTLRIKAILKCASEIVYSDPITISIYQPLTVVVTSDALNNTVNPTQNTVLHATATPIGTYNYSWASSPANGIASGGTTANPTTIGLTANTIYNVTVSQTGSVCPVATGTIDIKVNTGDLEVSLPASDTICKGDSYKLEPTVLGLPTKYTWTANPADATLINADIESPNVSPTVTTTYTIVIEDNILLKSENASITVNVYDKPTIAITGDLNLCNGESTTLTATGGDSGAIYKWSTGETTNPISVTIATATGTNYTVTVTNSTTCEGTKTEKVTLRPTPVADLDAGGTICEDEIYVLNADPNNLNSISSTYAWTGAMSSTGNPNAVETVGTNNVFVTVTSFYGCEAKDSTIVIVNALPKHLSEQDKIYTFISGQTQDVELKTDPQNINTNCNFEWRDNDSLYVSSDSPIYAVAPEEDFYYLTIITQDGCDITEKIEVIIKPANIEPYNVITPNGDDVNDYWVINFIEFYPLAEVTIFNRNGNMVYKPTTNYGPTNHFTGIYDNVTKKTLPAGVYFYVIDMSKYSDYKENNKELKGTLTIIKD